MCTEIGVGFSAAVDTGDTDRPFSKRKLALDCWSVIGIGEIGRVGLACTRPFLSSSVLCARGPLSMRVAIGGDERTGLAAGGTLVCRIASVAEVTVKLKKHASAQIHHQEAKRWEGEQAEERRREREVPDDVPKNWGSYQLNAGQVQAMREPSAEAF